jgi:hypothetical protein
MAESGERFPITYALADANGNAIDTEAHLHVRNTSGSTIEIKKRSTGDVTFATGVYTASCKYSFDGDTTLEFTWHFPDVDFVSHLTYEVILANRISETIT